MAAADLGNGMAARRVGPAVHWADQTADRVIAEKGPLGEQKPHYTCASGITPSGTVHIGNFREIVSVDLVARALRDAGQSVRFIYSWDDFDVFRKVPKNMPRQEVLTEYLRWPITDVPDPYEELESYAARNEHDLEEVLPEAGVFPEYLYQARKYRASEYAEGIRTALEHRDTIRALLDEHRTSPLPDDWWPVSVFSRFSHKDTTTVLGWDGEWGLTYRCDETGREETVDLRTTDLVKLPWRIDWPMRWKVEGVDFEPAGKEHHSAGGSFDTARTIARQVYGYDAPVTFKYDFISIKGRGGKISSSTGEVIGLPEVLEVYEPEIVRYLFASTRPNAEFAISFDLDVIKIYEDYDRCERIYFGLEEVGEKRAAKERRTYELSQLPSTLEKLTKEPSALIQVPFRTLCNFLMITAGDVDAALERFAEFDVERHADQVPRLRRRARCAWNWITSFAPADFRFELNSGDEEPVALADDELAALRALRAEVDSRLGSYDEKSMQERIYEIADEHGVDKKRIFTMMYEVLIGKERGPRLGGFLITIGRDRLLQILNRY
ncbi:MAG: lysine--tRNA ligase [Spirochaetota bacterium]